MGAKKKNKGNKLARMSEEERIRYLQHRAAIEEEARRRKEQLISTFLKNKLKREQIFSRLNVAKINQQWRYILRQIKCEEFKQELEELNKWFDYTLNKKNETIKLVLADLDEAECQYLKTHWAQMETIDKLLGIHQQRIDHYRLQYEKDRNEVYGKAIAQISEINASHKEDEEQLEAAIYRTEEAFNESTSLLSSRHFFKVDELRNNMLTDFENLKNSRESRIEDIWKELEMTLKEYSEQTEDRRRQYFAMREADRDNCRQIFDKNEQINEVIDSIESLKNQLDKVHKEGEQAIENRKNERRKAQELFQSLKKEVVNEINLDKKNLNYLNRLSDKTTDDLKEILERGKQILKLHDLCKNLESQREHLREDKTNVHLTEEEEEQIEEDIKKFVEPLAEKATSSITVLNKFWKRYNEVLLEKEALILYNRALCGEKKYLKAILKSYFSEMVVKQPESKVSYANGVRLRLQRPSTTIPLPRRNRIEVTSFTDLQNESPIRGLSVRIVKPVVGSAQAAPAPSTVLISK